MIQVTIIEMLKAGWQPNQIMTDDSLPDLLFSSDEIIAQLKRYGSRVYSAYTIDELPDVGTPLVQISDDWNTFCSTNQRNIDKMWAANMSAYNPLDNYSMIESGEDSTNMSSSSRNSKESAIDDTGTSSTSKANTRTLDTSSTLSKSGTETTEDSKTIKVEDTTTVITKNTGTVKNDDSGSTENSVSAYDVNTYSNRDKTANTSTSTRTDNTTEAQEKGGSVNTADSGKSTLTLATSDSTTDKGTISDSGKDEYTQALKRAETSTESISEIGTESHEHSLTRRGNIGVTTSQQMLTSEFVFRARNNLLYYIIELFISQYTTW